MKRWIIRLSILGGSMVCGWFAIAEVQRSQEDPIIRSVAANDEVPSPGAATHPSKNDGGFLQPSRPAVTDQGAAFAAAADQAAQASGASTKD